MALPQSSVDDLQHLGIFWRCILEEGKELLFDFFLTNVFLLRTISVAIAVAIPMALLDFPRNDTAALHANNFAFKHWSVLGVIRLGDCAAQFLLDRVKKLLAYQPLVSAIIKLPCPRDDPTIKWV